MNRRINFSWAAFWLFAALFLWIEHVQYMAGNETNLYRHKTLEEVRIREATVELLEAQAKKEHR